MKPTILRNIVASVVLLVLAAVGYFCFWPVPVEPVSWHAFVPPGYVGPHAANTRLSNINLIEIGDEFGPEHIAIGKDGRLYAAMTSGDILSMDIDGTDQKIFANTGGRVLGFDFDASGRMIAADAMKGLLAIDPDGKVTVLADRVSADDSISYANSIVIASNGMVYFTQSSTRFDPRKWGGTLDASVLDIIEQSATGRVLAYDPATGNTEVVAHGLSFANGLALSADQQSVFVNETGRYRIWRVDASARKIDVRGSSGQARVLLDNLPGYPDNLSRGLDGRIWVGLFRPRNPAADSLSERPFLRKILLRLPRSLLPIGKPYGHVFAINEDGDVLDDLQDPSGLYPETTGATEAADRLFIHSLHAHGIGWVPY